MQKITLRKSVIFWKNKNNHNNKKESGKHLTSRLHKKSNRFSVKSFDCFFILFKDHPHTRGEHRPDIDEKTNIWFDGRGYNIGFIDNVKYRNEYLEIKANYSKGVRPPDEY